MVLGVFAPTWPLALVCFFVPLASTSMFLAPGVALVQNVAPENRRAVYGALFLFVNNLIGAGLGPVYVGVISDHFTPLYGDQALRIAFAACLPIPLIAAGLQFMLSRTLTKPS